MNDEFSRADSPVSRRLLHAVYQKGALWPARPLLLPEGARVRLLVLPDFGAFVSGWERLPGPLVARTASLARVLPAWLAAAVTLEVGLFCLAMVVYLSTRLWALDEFPIYFFADEAINVLFAEDLIKKGFRSGFGELFPLYFDAAGHRWTPLLSVYVHAVSLILFGKSLLVTRATSALVSVLAALAVGLTLKLVFRVRFWWTGPLLLAAIPAWLLHSRTAFETVMMTAFFASFLCCYLLYRERARRFLFPAVVIGAATFYTYSNGQLVMAASGILLVLSDLRYHLGNWRIALAGALLALVLAVPAIGFQVGRPVATEDHLRAVGSYLFEAIPPHEKVWRFTQTYAFALSPQYWFFPNSQDLPRHRMDGLGNIRIEMFPLVLIGLALCIRRFRSSAYRTVLLAALAAPAGAALAGVGITRLLAFLVPASMMAGLGLNLLLELLARRVNRLAVSVATFLILAGANVLLLRAALVDGPFWFHEYGLYGAQYGAKQLFEEAIPDILARDPQAVVLVSSAWANGADRFIDFFLNAQQRTRVRMDGIDNYLSEKRELTDRMLFVMVGDESRRALASNKFQKVEVERIVLYPDGSVGFRFVRLGYVDDIDAVFAAEREARRALVETDLEIGGQQVHVRYSTIEAGNVRHMFDGDRFTLVRFLEANPAVIELLFPQPAVVRALAGDFGSMDFSLAVDLYAHDDAEAVSYMQTYRNLPPDPHVELVLDRGPATVSRLRIEVKDLRAVDKAKIHVRDLVLR